MQNHITIFDTTLRDGEQAPGASMTIPEKVEIAHQLAKLGVDVIEAGFPISSPAQFEAVQRIANEVKGSVICGLARANDKDIEAAGEALKGAEKSRIHTFIPTSDIHIESKFDNPEFGKTLADKRQTILKMTEKAVKKAKSFTDDVEFSAEDAGRTEIPFLCEVIKVAIDAGATTINIPDTTGFCTPADYAKMFTEVQKSLGETPNVIFSTHCHDDLGLAVANSLAGVEAGARQIECTLNGIGERAGNAALEEVVMALKVRNNHYKIDTKIDTKLLMATSQMVSVFSGFAVQPNKAIVGQNAFSHEAGIHQHGVLKNRATYEIMNAEDVGQNPEGIRLGRHSGRHGVFSRLKKLGIHVKKANRDDVYLAFVKLADVKKEIYDADLFSIAQEVKPRTVAETFVLKSLHVDVNLEGNPKATVEIWDARRRKMLTASATGNGPVDALYRAVDHATNEAHKVASYALQAISEGADAIGEASVTIATENANDNIRFAGTASHTDVLKASVNAYLDALNHLAGWRYDDAPVNFVTEGIMSSFGH